MTLTDHTGTPRRDTVTPEWIDILDGLGYARASEMAVAGDLAVPIAHLIQDSGGPPLALEWDAFAILSASGPPDIPEPKGPDDTRIPVGSLDFVIVRHGWGNAAGVAAVVDEAARILRPGGVLVLGDLDLDRLMRGRTRSYASKLLYQLYPAIARQIRAGLAMITDLSTELVRAGFDDVTALVVDETLGSYDDPADFLVAVRHNGWRGIADLGPSELDRLMEELERLLPDIAPIPPVVDKEPWRYAIGRMPASGELQVGRGTEGLAPPPTPSEALRTWYPHAVGASTTPAPQPMDFTPEPTGMSPGPDAMDALKAWIPGGGSSRR